MHHQLNTDMTASSMDWDDTRIFLAIYRAGTLRSAAATLNIDQATAGRRLAALEQALNARLFLRTPSGYVATPAGEHALAAAEMMEKASDKLQREIAGIDNSLSGVVRVATSDTMASHFVIPAMQKLHASHPDIRIVLSTATQLSNLTRREADIAVRLVRPTDPDLIARHLTKRKLGLFAAKTYLKKHPVSPDSKGLDGHDIITYQRHIVPRHAEKICGLPITNARVTMEVSSAMMLLEATRAGMGIAELAVHLAENTPLLTRLWPEREDSYDVWLVMHGDLARTARVRAVADAIIGCFSGSGGK